MLVGRLLGGYGFVPQFTFLGSVSVTELSGNDGGSSGTITAPSGSAGDLLVAMGLGRGTDLFTNPGSTWVQNYGVGTSNGVEIAWKEADGDSTDNIGYLSPDSTNGMVMVVMRFSVSATVSSEGVAGENNTGASDDTMVTYPVPIDSATTNNLVVGMVGRGDNSGVSSGDSGSVSSMPSPWILVDDLYVGPSPNDASNRFAVFMYYFEEDQAAVSRKTQSVTVVGSTPLLSSGNQAIYQRFSAS